MDKGIIAHVARLMLPFFHKEQNMFMGKIPAGPCAWTFSPVIAAQDIYGKA
jgi:hypothetical protein